MIGMRLAQRRMTSGNPTSKTEAEAMKKLCKVMLQGMCLILISTILILALMLS